MRSPDGVIWCLADILVTASPWLCPLKATNPSSLLPLSWSAPFHRSIKGKDLLVPSQIMYTRAFYNFNLRAGDVTTQRDPQVSLFPFLLQFFWDVCTSIWLLKSVSKVVPSIIWFVRSFICNMKRPSVNQSIKLQASSNLADEPSSANGPPRYQSKDDLADKPSSANGLTPVPEQKWLACHYTKLGRWTYFGQWIPLIPEQRCLEYQYTQLGRWTYFGWWTPQYQSRDALNWHSLLLIYLSSNIVLSFIV